MSSRASYYAKNLAVCPNGESITPREKLVLIVLADSHQDKGKHFTYPSIDTIATDALCDRRSCQRYLSALERKGVIARMRPPNQGRGMQVFYFFRDLDSIPEGWQPAALFAGESLQQKGGKRATEGRQKGGKSSHASITNINSNEELETTPPTPSTSEGGEFSTPTAVSTGNEVDLAVSCVCDALGIVHRRVRRIVSEVVCARAAAGESPPECAALMIRRWRRQAEVSPFLRVKIGLAKFFSQGYWLDENRWFWDEEKWRLHNEARMGSLQ